MLISLLNDVDIRQIVEFKNSLENITQPFLKILKGCLFGTPYRYIYIDSYIDHTIDC